MGSLDWSYLNDGLDIGAVDRGVTAGIAAPPGGGDFVFAMNSLAPVQGAVGLFVAVENFAPMQKGGSIRGCVQRGPGGGPTGFSPFLFLCCQGNSVNDQAYLLGLSDEDPHRIVLRKGSLALGVPDSDGQGALLKSGAAFAQGTWLHLRLDAVVNDNGDVVLRAYENDLAVRPLGTPADWQPIAGMDAFIDDCTAVNTGTQPLTSGRAGFGCAFSDTTRRGFFDHLELYRQL